jgi:ABC-2 type transport system permease protein
MNRRIPTAITMGVREFYRTPVLVAVLLVLPAYLIGAFVLLVPKTNIQVSLGGTIATVSLPAFATVFETAVSVAILSGIVGLFLVLSSEAADDRLRLAGYSDLELIVARVGTLGVSIVLVTAVTVGVALQVFQPANFWAFTAIVGLLGLTYGVVGILVGVLFDKLGGVYVMLLVPFWDVHFLLFQDTLTSDLLWWTEYLPGHYATTALFDAAFTAGVEIDMILGTIGYTIVLTVLSVVLFHHMSRIKS